ncbi:MAG: glycosyltransferase family 4 protein [Candidatus Abawacabacteria bacterium]|nr:glycosyltransferase family 4 protein [Candidatus Abawacabacteria bacterium]
MRIAIIADPVDEQYAGVHIYVKEVIKSLLKNDTENTYVFVHTRENSFFANTEHYIIPNYRNIPAYASFRILFLVPRLLKTLKLDAVWNMNHSGPFNLPKYILRINTILDLTPVLLPQVHLSMSTIIHKIFLPIIVKNSDLLLCYSDNTVNDLLRLYPRAQGKTAMIYLGKDPMFVPTNDSAVLQKYGIYEPYILYLGTIEPRKNVACLVEAYEFLRQRTKLKHKLVIAGKKGWKYEPIIAKIMNSPFKEDILVTDYVSREDMPALYTGAAVFVFPSIYEGFGLPLLEAMACGTACVSSNASSLPEVGGDAVLYFDPTKSEQLSVALQNVLSNQAIKSDLQKKALLQATLFSWDEYAKKVMPLFANLANEKK